MSWSVSKVGIKEKVREACIADFDKAAKGYEGKEEEQDILMAKTRVLSALAEIDTNPDMWTPNYGVSVSASGSRSTYSCTINIAVTRTGLII